MLQGALCWSPDCWGSEVVELETRCIEHMEPKRAFEATFHLENSKGVQVLCVEWKGWKVGWEASGQAGAPSVCPQSH